MRRVQRVRRDRLVLQERRAQLALRDQPAQQDLQVHKGVLELLGLRVHKDNKGVLASQVRQVLLDHRDLKVPLELRAQLARLVRRVCKEARE